MRRAPMLALCLLVVLAGCSSGGTTTSTEVPAAPGVPQSPSPSAEQYRVTVIDVVDGDTLDVRFPDGSTDTVRLLGVDTPEVYGSTDPAEFEGVPDTDGGRQCLRNAGEAASAFADQLQGETVTLALDEQADRRGGYGRLLAYVYADGANFNYRLVAEGYARVYDSRFSLRERFYAAEREAQAAGRGVWTCRSSAPATTVPDLSGWTVGDAAGHTYEMPRGTTVEPGATLTLYTGAGTDSRSALFWGSDSAV